MPDVRLPACPFNRRTSRGRGGALLIAYGGVVVEGADGGVCAVRIEVFVYARERERWIEAREVGG